MGRRGAGAVRLSLNHMEDGATDLLIVARDQPGLYVYLRHDFAEDADVRVIMNRRVRERRRQPMSVADERRRTDRRASPELAAKLASIGFAIVRCDEPARA